MRFQGNFETFKFVDHGGKIQSVMDYIEGESIFYKIQNSVQFSKVQLLEWISDLCSQLDCYHRYKHHAYQYVNPYTIIITNEQQIRLLNMDSKENEDILIYIQKAIIKDSFYFQSNSKRNKIYTDCYSLGKLLQFLLSSGDFTPHLKVREIRIFSKIIQKCLSNDSENQFQNMKQIQKKFPKVKEQNSRTSLRVSVSKYRKNIIVISVVLLVIIGYMGSQEILNYTKVPSGIAEEITSENSEKLLLESGIIMLACVEDLTQSQECFQVIETQDSLGQDYQKLVSYYRGELSLTEEDIQALLQQMEKKGKQEVGDELYYMHILNIVRGYHKLHTEQKDGLLIKSIEENIDFDNTGNMDSKYLQEFREYLLQAYVKLGKIEEAQLIIEQMEK